ncbi:MAG: nuclear transport factor 2 family protein [Planctomycetes bacterium]|nr:nuclear transport factor 2 family protein [Planctomycetota bacterium]MCP4770412.1 nuclear transport factor 2 family protein [Planctomycetota bacterium]MCP4860496.1 nuclear transport factor 2 family protein [Planctomycetota bacterium]
MTHSPKWIHSALLALLAVLPACSSKTEPLLVADSALDEAVQAMSDQFLEHWNGGDAEALAGMFAPDAVRIVSTQKGPLLGRDAIQASFQQGMETYKTSDEAKLKSEIGNVQELGGDIILADGTFALSGADGASVMEGKWGTVYRNTEEGLVILMESAHVDGQPSAALASYATDDLQSMHGADDAEYADAMQAIIDSYTAGLKGKDAGMLAGTFTENGIQLVASMPQTNRGRAAIETAFATFFEQEDFGGRHLRAKMLNHTKISDSLVAANGVWREYDENRSLIAFGQWGNLLEIQEDGTLLMVMEAAGPFTVSD